MSKNTFTVIGFLGLMLLVTIFFCYQGDIKKNVSESKEERPNIVILIADDISRDDFGCYGHPVIKTPNIDKLSENGIRFTNAVLTTSSCSPSRVSIITGRYPHNTGAGELHAPLPEHQIVFPQKLKDAGYYTAQSGKWHFGDAPVVPSGIAFKAFDRSGGSALDKGGPSGSERWVEVLKERPKDKPFFMWFAAHDAHRKWDDKTEINYDASEVIVPPYMVDDLETRTDLASYYQEVSRFDQNVGKVVEALKSEGVLENTLIIVMADNGRPFPRDKTRLYDSGILTPFIVHYPNKIKKGGEVSHSLLSIIDIAPTVIELAGVESSKTFQGKSFEKLLSNPKQPFREYAFAEHNWHDYAAFERMIRTEKYTYIENGLPQNSNIGAIDVLSGGAGQTLLKGIKQGNLNELQGKIFQVPQPKAELYDHKKDPDQFNSVLGEAAYAGIEKALKNKLDDWRKKTKDIQPEVLTPDWYDRETMEELPTKGVRGIIPGSNFKSKRVIN
ncbi:sulfatase [Tamlana sp. 2201CG12-4]|uniref:sulfatase family protein n=1 Tax=Tamlana sp. 2201CG12-4 TaxID=3112582 RepID=UPI002DBA88F8|nr:sulfatase [Tamlana sp. 2201CG12-4]MEC3908654.1 sulfatase [Tamlana sp. 2201CG12-4]